MTKPDEIPNDVWEYAEAVTLACRGLPTSERIAQHARAIMAEREACAQVAEEYETRRGPAVAAAIRKRGVA